VPEPYRVPKRSIPAEVVLPGKPPSKLTLFLSDFAETHGGIERPSDLLNGPALFFPAADASGAMVFLHRDSILAVTVRAEHEFAGDVVVAMALQSEHATSAKVEVTLEDGTAIQGVANYLMPEGKQRLQDYLNLPDRFLVLRDGDHVRLVNKLRVIRVTPL